MTGERKMRERRPIGKVWPAARGELPSGQRGWELGDGHKQWRTLLTYGLGEKRWPR